MQLENTPKGLTTSCMWDLACFSLNVGFWCLQVMAGCLTQSLSDNHMPQGIVQALTGVLVQLAVTFFLKVLIVMPVMNTFM